MIVDDTYGSGDGSLLNPAVLWHVERADEPVLGLAVHAGHEVRPELMPYLAIDEVTRVREEDPYSDYWVLACGNRLFTRRSRFEVDLNRTRAEAICIQPEDCWNLKIWKGSIDGMLMERSLAEYDAFYRAYHRLLSELADRFRRFLVLDFHAYNHRRGGPDAPCASEEENPEINVGTGSLDRERWAPVVDAFVGALRDFGACGRPFDVRENVRFEGRRIAEFVHERHAGGGCALAIEVKKVFMDEWTGVVDPVALRALRAGFRAAAECAMEALDDVPEA